MPQNRKKVASGRIDAARSAEIDEHLGAPADELPPEREQLPWAARAYGVAKKSVDEAGIFKNGRSRWSFDVDGKICQHPAISVREGFGNQVERGQGDQGISQTAETVNKDTSH